MDCQEGTDILEGQPKPYGKWILVTLAALSILCLGAMIADSRGASVAGIGLLLVMVVCWIGIILSLCAVFYAFFMCRFIWLLGWMVLAVTLMLINVYVVMPLLRTVVEVHVSH